MIRRRSQHIFLSGINKFCVSFVCYSLTVLAFPAILTMWPLKNNQITVEALSTATKATSNTKIVLPLPQIEAVPDTATAATTAVASRTKTAKAATQSPSGDARLLARKLKEFGSIDEAFVLLAEHPYHLPVPLKYQRAQQREQQEPLPELVAAELLNLCGKSKNADMALQVVNLVPHSSICRSRAISILGNCGRTVDALNVLTRHPPLSNTGPYNSAIAAQGKAKDWQAVLCILHDMPPELVTTVTLNAALTALRKAKRSQESLALLQAAASASSSSSSLTTTTTATTKWERAKPNHASYHETLSTLLEQGQVVEACQLIRQMEKASNQQESESSNSNKNDSAIVRPNAETYSRLMGAVTSGGCAHSENHYNEHPWQIVQRLLPDKIGKEIPAMQEFQKWTLPKVGRGKHAYWELGTYKNSGDDAGDGHVLVALQPNRNPATNGIKLAFYRVLEDTKGSAANHTKRTEKLGYLLMINSHQTRSSQFLGQFVDESCRGQGLAKVWLAIWLRLCIDAGLRPWTGKMRKPLLCLVLQHTFGMIPQAGGVEAELSPGQKEGEVLLYSASQSLEGAVSPLDLRHQNIRLGSAPTDPRGRPIVLGCTFEAPNETHLQEAVTNVLRNRFSLNELAQQRDLGQVLLGAG